MKPCVKVRDLEDPFGDRKRGASDGDANSKVKSSVEIGVKVEF